MLSVTILFCMFVQLQWESHLIISFDWKWASQWLFLYSFSFVRLEMLEKQEIPSIPDGYPLIVAMKTLFDLIKSTSVMVNNQLSPSSLRQITPSKAELPEVSKTMLSSSWSAILSALAILLDTVWVVTVLYTLELLILDKWIF